jgi:hypothetical protein
MKGEVVYNVLFKKYTYQECKEREVNLGLDLKGGMNVILEIAVEDIIRSLAATQFLSDPVFTETMSMAHEKKKNSQSDFVDLFAESFEELRPQKEDLPLVEWLLRDDSNLFIVFLWSLKRPIWFDILAPNIFQRILKDSERESIRVSLISKLKDWMNVRPSEVIALWETALSDNTAAATQIIFALNTFEPWETPGISDFLGELIAARLRFLAGGNLAFALCIQLKNGLGKGLQAARFHGGVKALRVIPDRFDIKHGISREQVRGFC